MNCTECLSLVATAGVSELTTAAAVTEHCRTCPDCAAVVDEVAEEARRFADTLDGTPPGVHPHVIAMRAVAASSRARRRGERGRGALFGGGVIVALLAALFTARMVAPAAAPPAETRTIELRCLPLDHALELARARVPGGVTVSARRGLPVVTLRGPHADVEAAAAVRAEVDASPGPGRDPACARSPDLRPDAPRAP